MKFPPQHITRILVSLLIGLIVGIAINEISFYFLGTGSTRAAGSYEIDIPLGTQEKILAGESVSIIPQNLRFVIGDELVIRNQDTVDHHFGNLFIPSGTTSTLTFDQANSFAYECSFESKKVFGFEVQEPLTTSTRLFGIFLAGIPLGVMIYIYSLAAYPVSRTNKNEA